MRTHIGSLAVFGVLLSVAIARNVPRPSNGLRWTKEATRLNDIQVIGSRAHYRAKNNEEEHGFHGQPSNKAISKTSPLPIEYLLDEMQIRSLEFDVYVDSAGGISTVPPKHDGGSLSLKHYKESQAEDDKLIPAFKDEESRKPPSSSFKGRLESVKKWLDNHPESVPISIIIQPHLSIVNNVKWVNETTPDDLDNQIKAVFEEKQLIRPENIRTKGYSLESTLLEFGWPDLDSVRGRAFFLLDVPPRSKSREAYTEGRLNLRDRVMFTNSVPGERDCAFQQIEYPDNFAEHYLAHVKAQVAKGYMVRTHANTRVSGKLDCDEKKLKKVFESGTQIVSVNLEDKSGVATMDCKDDILFDGDMNAVCNPVKHPFTCVDDNMETEDYRERHL